VPAVIVAAVASRVLRNPRTATITVPVTPTTTPRKPLAPTIQAASMRGLMNGNDSGSGAPRQP